MLKLLLLVLAVWLVVSILKRYPQQHHASPPTEKTGDMVQCTICEVHLPESEAISAQGRHYCCEAHFLQRNKR